MHAPTEPIRTSTPAWLALLLQFTLWTEWQLVSVLCGLPPASVDVPRSAARNSEEVRRRNDAARQQAIAEAAPRHDATRHVEDARLAGHLVVVERTLAPEHVDGARVYSETRRFQVAAAIRWALSRRAMFPGLFPGCPLTQEHLAIAEAAQAAAPRIEQSAPTSPLTFETALDAGTGSPAAVLQQRADWLRGEMGRRNLNLSSLKPLDPDTVRKILAAQKVNDSTLDKLAHRLGVPLREIPGAPKT